MGAKPAPFTIHGLTVSSSIPLDGVRADDPAAPIDLEIAVVGELPRPPTTGEKILSYEDGDGGTVCAVADSTGAVLVSFSDRTRFRISPGRDRIELATQDPGEIGMATIFLQGWIMSMTLMLRDCIVMHATAVEFERGCVALLGDSGMGKSTIAAMLVRDGGQLVSDDVLRIEPPKPGRENRWLAHPGLTALRLRPAAVGLAGSVPNAELDSTPDGRTAVRFNRTSRSPVPLDAVLIPSPSRTVTEVAITWLEPVQATIELDRYPRVYDWAIDGPIRNHFEAMAALSSDVAVGVVTVPWGPPWPAGLYGRLSDLLPSSGR